MPLPAGSRVISPHAAAKSAARSRSARPPARLRAADRSTAVRRAWALAVLVAAIAFFLVARAQLRARRRPARRSGRCPASAWRFRCSPLPRRRPPAERILLALPHRVRRPAALRAVRQPQPLRDLGDHGDPAVPRIPRGPLGPQRTRRRTTSRWRRRVALAIDPRTTWLTSRPRHDARGAAAVAVAIGRRSRSASPPAITVAVFAPAARAAAAPPSASSRRLSGSLFWARLGRPARLCARACRRRAHGVANRLTIWRETMPIVRDFWLAGTGAGTYQRAMCVYQQSDRSGVLQPGAQSLPAGCGRGRSAARWRGDRLALAAFVRGRAADGRDTPASC